jgi:hypothetical protein
MAGTAHHYGSRLAHRRRRRRRRRRHLPSRTTRRHALVAIVSGGAIYGAASKPKLVALQAPGTCGGDAAEESAGVTIFCPVSYGAGGGGGRRCAATNVRTTPGSIDLQHGSQAEHEAGSSATPTPGSPSVLPAGVVEATEDRPAAISAEHEAGALANQRVPQPREGAPVASKGEQPTPRSTLRISGQRAVGQSVVMPGTLRPVATMVAVVRVRVEIMGPGKYENVGKSQSVLTLIHPIIFTRSIAPPHHRRRSHTPAGLRAPARTRRRE